MANTSGPVEKSISMSPVHAERLSRLSDMHRITEDAVVGRALDLFFQLTEILTGQAERREWSDLSAEALSRVWDNDKDAVYDNWRDLYGVPAR